MIIKMSEKLLLSELERTHIDFVRRMVWNSVWNSCEEVHDPQLRACLETLDARFNEFLDFTDFYEVDDNDVEEI